MEKNLGKTVLGTYNNQREVLVLLDPRTIRGNGSVMNTALQVIDPNGSSTKPWFVAYRALGFDPKAREMVNSAIASTLKRGRKKTKKIKKP